MAWRVGKMPTTLVRRRISLLRRSWGLLDQIWDQWALGNPVNARRSEAAPSRWSAASTSPTWRVVVDDPAVLGPDLVGGGLSEDGDVTVVATIASELLGTLVSRFSRVVGAAPLPPRTWESGGHRVDQSRMVVGDDQLHPREAPSHQGTQEGEPAGPVLRRGDVDAEDLPVSVAVDGHCQEAGDVDHPSAFAHLDRQRVGPQVGVGAGVEGPVAEIVDHLVEFLGQLGDLRLRQRGDSQRLDQPGHPAGRHTFDVGFGDHLGCVPVPPGCGHPTANQESTTPPAVSGYAGRCCPPACPTAAPDTRCVDSPAPRNVPDTPPRTGRRPRPPSTSPRRCAPSHPADPHLRPRAGRFNHTTTSILSVITAFLLTVAYTAVREADAVITLLKGPPGPSYTTTVDATKWLGVYSWGSTNSDARGRRL